MYEFVRLVTVAHTCVRVRVCVYVYVPVCAIVCVTRCHIHKVPSKEIFICNFMCGVHPRFRQQLVRVAFTRAAYDVLRCMKYFKHY
jgi:hypothetical protein